MRLHDHHLHLPCLLTTLTRMYVCVYVCTLDCPVGTDIVSATTIYLDGRWAYQCQVRVSDERREEEEALDR